MTPQWNVSYETFTDLSDNEVNEIDVTVEIVRDALKSSSDGTGPDLIPGRILRKCSNSLSIHFYNLIFLIIQSGDYLSPWKRTIITPIFKDGRNAEISIYRPIASLSKLSLAFERIVYNTILKNTQNKICPHQFGFRKSRSSCTQILSFFDKISE